MTDVITPVFIVMAMIWAGIIVTWLGYQLVKLGWEVVTGLVLFLIVNALIVEGCIRVAFWIQS